MKTILKFCSAVCAAVLLAGVGGAVGAIAQDDFSYTAFAQTYTVQTGILDAPTVTFAVDSAEDLAALESEKLPAAALFTVDGRGNAVDSEGGVIAPLDTAVRACANRVIPAFRFGDSAGMNAVLTYATGKNLIDMMVFSDRAELVRAFKAERPAVQGGVIFAEADLAEHSEIVSVRDEVNGANAMIAVVGAGAGKEGVAELRSLGLSCWVLAESSPIGVYNALYAGADGMVCDSFSLPIDLMEEITEPLLVRRVFYSGHRGELSMYPENTVEAAHAAYYYGADYVELDLQRTSDNELIVMHDATLSTTTDYSGTKLISQMTLEEVRASKVSGRYEIPVLEDFLDFAAARPDVKLLIELKTNDELVPGILAEKLANRGLDDQILVISAFTDRLKDFRALMPHISVNNLNSYTSLTALTYNAYTLNTSFGPWYSYLAEHEATFLLAEARVRGIPAYVWTFRTAAAWEEYVSLCTSLTSDFGGYARQEPLLLDAATEAEYTSVQAFSVAGTLTQRFRGNGSFADRTTAEAGTLTLVTGAALDMGSRTLSEMASYADGILTVGIRDGYGIAFFTAQYAGTKAEYAYSVMSRPFEICIGADARTFRAALDEAGYRALALEDDGQDGNGSGSGGKGGCNGLFSAGGMGSAAVLLAGAAVLDALRVRRKGGKG